MNAADPVSGRSLLDRAAQLVAIGSVSRDEAAIAAHVESLLRAAGLAVERIGDNVVARTQRGARRRAVLAGHLDTVPPSGNADVHIDGDVLWGLGATDMKGGLAILCDLAMGAAASPDRLPGGSTGEARDVQWDLTVIFYAREEVDRGESGLAEVARVRPELVTADAAILLEPTGGRVEAGCQGTMRARVTVGGLAAHTARPWEGRNAIHRLADVVDLVRRYEGRRPVIEGCAYRESLQAVRIAGGVANNVVPDEASVVVNHRFAPDRSIADARAHLDEVFGPLLDASAHMDGGTIDVEDSAPGAPPRLDEPVIAALVRASGQPARAKLGWTDVAFFAERGMPAVNFGPGDPDLAHTPREHVTSADLGQVRSVLGELLGIA